MYKNKRMSFVRRKIPFWECLSSSFSVLSVFLFLNRMQLENFLCIQGVCKMLIHCMSKWNFILNKEALYTAFLVLCRNFSFISILKILITNKMLQVLCNLLLTTKNKLFLHSLHYWTLLCRYQSLLVFLFI
jgi:hypothetical protein